MKKKPGDAPDKAGVRSLSKKLDTARHDFEPHPASNKTAGAFAKENRNEKAIRGHESASGATKEGKTKPLGRMKRSG